MSTGHSGQEPVLSQLGHWTMMIMNPICYPAIYLASISQYTLLGQACARQANQQRFTAPQQQDRSSLRAKAPPSATMSLVECKY